MKTIIPLLIFLIGCQPTIQTRYVTTELSRPVRPLLPRVSAAELECVSQDAYQRLYDRQRLVVDYAVELEAIIDSTRNLVK